MRFEVLDNNHLMDYFDMRARQHEITQKEHDIHRLSKILDSRKAVPNKKGVHEIPEHERYELLRKWDILGWFGLEHLIREDEMGKPQYSTIYSEFYEDVCWHITKEHINRVKEFLKSQIKLYEQIKNGEIFFNKKNLDFYTVEIKKNRRL